MGNRTHNPKTCQATDEFFPQHNQRHFWTSGETLAGLASDTVIIVCGRFAADENHRARS